jgi:molecular chaperone GrpE
MAEHAARATAAAPPGEPTGVPPAAPPAPEAEDAQDLAATVAELRAEAARQADQHRRTAADLDNLRKRMIREADQQRADERARVTAEWLPVLDNLELALEHAAGNPNAVLAGVQAVRDQAVAVLSRLGFTRLADIGTTFDPARHEAVAAVADPVVPAGTVVQVVRPGYGNDERQLRPASVVVATRAD